MVFKPGQSGNPAGHPQGRKKQLADLFRRDIPKAVEVIRAALDDPDNCTWAAKEILDRVYGKAMQSLSAEVTGQQVVNVIFKDK